MAKKKQEPKKVNKELTQQLLGELKALQTSYKEKISEIVSNIGDGFIAKRILPTEIVVEYLNEDDMNPEGLSFELKLNNEDSNKPFMSSYINPRGIIEPITDRRHTAIMWGYGKFVNDLNLVKTVQDLMIDEYRKEAVYREKLSEA